VDRGVELSVAIDRFAGQIGIRDAQGAWGVLSGNLVDATGFFSHRGDHGVSRRSITQIYIVARPPLAYLPPISRSVLCTLTT